MVIGVLVSSSPTPTVRAVKIQDLSSCVVAETMWMLEVVDIPRIRTSSLESECDR